MSRVRYGQSGYSGFSRSVRAAEAEHDGKLPLTRAVAAVAERTGCTRKVAREALKLVGPCEWHHTSKYANATDYYSIDEAANYVGALPILAKLPADWKEQISAAMHRAEAGRGYLGPMTAIRKAAKQELCGRFAEIAGCSAETIDKLYYDIFDAVA